jgi:hypothetical protein
MKRAFVILGMALLASAGLNTAASASSVTFVIKDIGSVNFDKTATYAGQGYVGMFDNTGFENIFGLEATHTRTALEADISTLFGTTINNATLTFDITSCCSGTTGTLTATSFSANGALGFYWTPPDVLGTAVTGIGFGGNSVDVTTLLANRVSGGNQWFGLQLTNANPSLWTWSGASLDDAHVRLTVDYTGAVPDPGSSLLLLGIGLAGLRVWKTRLG